MERNLLYHEIENVSASHLPAKLQREFPDTALQGVGTIHYVDLVTGGLTFPKSAIFIPDHFNAQRNKVDVILYFHGLIIPACSGDSKTYGRLGMKSYLENNKFFEKICPLIAEAKSNVIFIAVPWLLKFKKNEHVYEGRPGDRNKITAQDFHALMANILSRIKGVGASGLSPGSEIGNIILAGHSAGGGPMQNIIMGVGDSKISQTYLSRIKECWGFDSQYAGSVSTWLKWLKHNEHVYKHFSVGKPSSKGFRFSKYKESHPKSKGMPPFMNISNLWKLLVKDQSVDDRRYYFVERKTSHCAMVYKSIAECLKTSKNIMAFVP